MYFHEINYQVVSNPKRASVVGVSSGEIWLHKKLCIKHHHHPPSGLGSHTWQALSSRWRVIRCLMHKYLCNHIAPNLFTVGAHFSCQTGSPGSTPRGAISLRRPCKTESTWEHTKHTISHAGFTWLGSDFDPTSTARTSVSLTHSALRKVPLYICAWYIDGALLGDLKSPRFSQVKYGKIIKL
jgi:hypothetical protein